MKPGVSFDDSFPGRVRGALGQILRAESKYCGDAEILFTLLFDETADWRRNSPTLPRPFAISMRKGGRFVTLDVVLIGVAAYYGRALARSLVGALERGIAVAERSPVRTPLDLWDVDIDALCGHYDTRGMIKWACLVFHAPVSVMQGKRTHVTAENLVRSISARICRLAAWQDLHFSPDVCEAMLNKMTWTVHPVGSARHAWNSSRQRRAGLVMQGERLMLIGEGAATGVLPFLRIAETVGVGARTAFGYGAFRLFAV
ncbi:MAG: hypothetical protein ACWA5T_07670 [Parvularcula sp.]